LNRLISRSGDDRSATYYATALSLVSLPPGGSGNSLLVGLYSNFFSEKSSPTAMYQDGSDQKSRPSGGESLIAIMISAHNNSYRPANQAVASGSKGLSHPMSLMLLDSDETYVASQLVPLARSYDVRLKAAWT